MKRNLMTVTLLLALTPGAVAQTAASAAAVRGQVLALTDQTETERLVVLPFSGVEVVEGEQLVLAQPLAAGTKYVAGSARLGTQPLEPALGANGTLYWTVPAQAESELSFKVTGAGTLPAAALARLSAERQLRPVSGKVVAGDYLLARPAAVAQPEGSGQIKLPRDGAEYRTTDQITLVVEGPAGQELRPRVNGAEVPASQIGTATVDSGRGVQRLEFYGVKLRPGANTVQLGSDSVTVFLAGAVSEVKVTPLQLVADGSTPLRLKVETLDALGKHTAQSYLTVDSNLEPLIPDAEPGVAGYQLRIRDGEGLLELQPQTTPATLQMDFLLGEAVSHQSLEVMADQREVGVGVLSATFGLSSLSDGLSGSSWQGRAYYEGPWPAANCTSLLIRTVCR
ncbi:hypothetical protein ACFP81_12355 [Deinococcus lacus]|uniref:Uncharacterized protein n=1 Tax=Deinococcus lacus TaxID=392561 RepID=A0ABW1YGP3_9DEIO